MGIVVVAVLKLTCRHKLVNRRHISFNIKYISVNHSALETGNDMLLVYTIILNFSLTSRWSHLGYDHTNEIKHDIHPE